MDKTERARKAIDEALEAQDLAAFISAKRAEILSHGIETPEDNPHLIYLLAQIYERMTQISEILEELLQK